MGTNLTMSVGMTLHQRRAVDVWIHRSGCEQERRDVPSFPCFKATHEREHHAETQAMERHTVEVPPRVKISEP